MRRGIVTREAWLALILASCAAPLPRWTAESDSLRIAVAPVNLAVVLPADLAEAAPLVEDEILRRLVSADARVALLWLPDARRLWHQAVLSTQVRGNHPTLVTTAAEFVRIVHGSADTDFDVLVLPSIMYRQARVRGLIASWDGVERRMVVLGEAERPAHRDRAVRLTRRWQGEIPGISLHVLAFRPDGRLIDESWGGLELAHRAVEPIPGSTGAALLYPKEAPFEDLRNVREGIAIALDPFVP